MDSCCVLNAPHQIQYARIQDTNARIQDKNARIQDEDVKNLLAYTGAPKWH